MSRTGTHVYFVQVKGGGLVKVGCTEMPLARFAGLQNWSPVPLEVVGLMKGDLATEAYFHFKLREYRSHGEWFHPAPPVLATMEIVRSTGAHPNAPTDWKVKREGVVSRVRSFREDLGLSREEMARTLQVTLSTYRHNEVPSGYPQRVMSARLIAFLEERGRFVSMDDLVAAGGDKLRKAA